MAIVGVALFNAGRRDEAMKHFLRSPEIKPDFAVADYYLGEIFASTGRFKDAIRAPSQGAENVPDRIGVQRLAWVMATCPDGTFHETATSP